MIPQDKFNDDRFIFLISTFLAIYFVFIFLNANYLNISYDLLEVIQELVTLPLMFLNCFLLVYLVNISISTGFYYKSYHYKSLILVFTSNSLTWGSIVKTAYSHIIFTSITGLFLSILPVLFLTIVGIFLLRIFFKKYLNSY